MALSFPLPLPSVLAMSGFEIVAQSTVGATRSPFTGAQQTYAWPGEWWGSRVSLPPMRVEKARGCIAFIVSLNGLEGSFLMGPDPVNAGPLGTWAGSPKVLGAHAAGVKTIAMDGFSIDATVKAGDWFQSGIGAASRLHQVVKDATADGSGLLTLEIWPRTRAALADNATFITASPKGIFMLESNERGWRQTPGGIFVVVDFGCVEDLRDV